MKKEKEINFIKNFSAIKLSDILKKYKINPSNFYKGKVSLEKVNLVKKEIDKQIINLYYERDVKDEKENEI